MATLVLTVIGDDRPGLVDALASRVAAHGGNWDRSNLARLAGKFAGIVVVTVPDEQVEDLTAGFESLADQGVLDVRSAIADVTTADRATPAVTLHLVGQDRPGIVKEIAAALAARDVSIDEFETSTGSAPMSGEQLFEATAALRLPPTVTTDELRIILEDIANELMVDLDLDLAEDSVTDQSANPAPPPAPDREGG
jgi:glycine cleavage system regulatory protein